MARRWVLCVRRRAKILEHWSIQKQKQKIAFWSIGGAINIHFGFVGYQCETKVSPAAYMWKPAFNPTQQLRTLEQPTT
jgi:hypothetical protein